MPFIGDERRFRVASVNLRSYAGAIGWVYIRLVWDMGAIAGQRPAEILLVDDEPALRDVVRSALEQARFAVHEAGSLTQMWQLLKQRPATNLILLDLNLPDGDALSIAASLRERFEGGVIVITGRSDPVDRIVGLETGADDYLAKPLDLRELIARVRSVLRRVGGLDRGRSHSVYRFDRWTYDAAAWRLSHDEDGDVALTQYEAALLRLFLESNGQTLSRSFLAQSLGGRPHEPQDRSIDNLVSRLRKKLARDPQTGRRIRAVRGIGYQMVGEIQSLPDAAAIRAAGAAQAEALAVRH